MKALDDIKEVIEKELKKIAKKDDLTPQELDSVYKAVDVLKDIQEICEKEEDWDEGMSMRGSYAYERPAYRSNARGRDTRGRYTSREGSYYNSYDRRYSRHTEREKMVDMLEMMASNTTDPSVRATIEQAMQNLE